MSDCSVHVKPCHHSMDPVIRLEHAIGGFRPSVPHVACPTDDIFTASIRLAEHRFSWLQIGQNYHDDLQARFGLPASLVGRR